MLIMQEGVILHSSAINRETEMDELMLDDIIELFGGEKQGLAKALGIDPSGITRWGSVIPDGHQMRIWRILKADRSLLIKYNKIKKARKGAEKNG